MKQTQKMIVAVLALISVSACTASSTNNNQVYSSYDYSGSFSSAATYAAPMDQSAMFRMNNLH